jgi:hypothetical protein
MEIFLTHDQHNKFRWACDWIIKHAEGQFGDQPLDFVKLDYLSYTNFIDQFANKKASFQRSQEYSKMASEKYVKSVTVEQEDQNLKDVITWRLSQCMAETTYEVDQAFQLFPKTKLEIRALLRLINHDDKYDLIRSYLTSLF